MNTVTSNTFLGKNIDFNILGHEVMCVSTADPSFVEGGKYVVEAVDLENSAAMLTDRFFDSDDLFPATDERLSLLDINFIFTGVVHDTLTANVA